MIKHDKSILGDILHPNDFVLLLVGIVPGIDISSSANGSRIKQHQNCNLLFGWKLDIFGHGPICLWFLVCVSRFSPYMLVIQPTHLFSGHASSRSALVAGTWRRLGQTKPGNSVILEDFLWVIFTKKTETSWTHFVHFTIYIVIYHYHSYFCDRYSHLHHYHDDWLKSESCHCEATDQMYKKNLQHIIVGSIA